MKFMHFNHNLFKVQKFKISAIRLNLCLLLIF